MRLVRLQPVRKTHKVNLPFLVDTGFGIDIPGTTFVKASLQYRAREDDEIRVNSPDLQGGNDDHVLFGTWNVVKPQILSIKPTVPGFYNVVVVADFDITSPPLPREIGRVTYESVDIKVT